MDYRIESMVRHPEGFLVAEVRDFHSQNLYIIHNRFGSWMIGDPDDRNAPMRDIPVFVAADLQQYSISNNSKIKGMEPAPPPVSPKLNPFIERAKAQKAQRANPFIKKKV